MTLKRSWKESISGFTSLISEILDPRSWIVIVAFFAIITVNHHSGGDGYRDGKITVFAVAVCLAASYWIGKNVQVLLGIAYAIVSVRWVWDQCPPYGLLTVAGIPGMLFLAKISSEVPWLTLLCLRVAAWVQVILCYLQILDIETFGSNNPFFRFLLTGSLGHPIVVGAFLAMLVPVACRFFTWVEALLFLFFAVYANSTCASLGLVVASCFFMMKRYGSWHFVAIGAAAAVVCIAGAYYHPEIEFFSFSGRFVPRKRAWELILANPYGYGAGSWFGRYPEWAVPYDKVWDFLHSEPIQLLFEGGWQVFIPTAIGTVLLVFSIEMWAACSLIIILVDSFGAFPMHLAALNFLTCVTIFLGKGLSYGKSISNP